MKITAQQVNELRKITGAGMMDCKKALVETNGDQEKAIDYLRKKGQKVAAKRADREAAEGVVLAKVSDDKKFAAAVMINCETDFVAKNQDFIAYVQSVIDLAVAQQAKSLDELKAMKLGDRTVEESVIEKTGVIGEKIQLGKYEVVEAESTYAYIHPGNRIAAIAGLNKAGDAFAEAGHDVVMQIAAMAPVAVDKDRVPQEVIDRELEIGKEQALQEGKPEQMVEKIAMGKLNKFFKENTLLNQAFIKDSKKTVKQYLEGYDKDLTVTDFKRLALG
ncbi:translation elongation factor Ts [Candidatus Sulfidibacterium hydrothermale]|uniref:translation elongation factor Ts n=1 Tax=Candidatus Sulfidibacterium hydrothermale TaxID=2875962 RepID=UPI001F0A3D83|nr:translation elongation factor Ts [Candidatus Sulfidibacterium hydrothermale]UBM63069.1 translation elongation factor Ts [Candidatus Sulfidibacterium hydrothermale]